MKIENEVLNVLGNSQMDGNQLKIAEQLTRNMYERVNKIIAAAGGKWNRKAGAHVFDGDAASIMDSIILTGEIETLKTRAQLFGYFPTQPPVVDRLMVISDVRQGMATMEPSAGRGAIALKLLDAGADVMMYELMEENYQALLAAVNAHPGHRGSLVMQRDFLTVDPAPLYDRIVMNPPFDKQADIHHVNHAVKFLKPDGLLTSVMSAGVSFRDNKLTTEFRELIRQRGGEIEALPQGSFKESGTGVNTVIVTIPGVDY